jgi:UDP-N-acetylmuramate dehydrogenase
MVESNRHLCEVGAGCLNAHLSKFAVEHNIAGFEFLSGIPGTIGGGIAMNAGAYGREFKDIIVSVEGVDFSGNAKIFTLDEMKLTRRHNELSKDFVFTKAILRGNDGDYDKITSDLKEIQNRRNASQPIKERTTGSTFVNPESSPHRAWELIDMAGMRGFRVGGAMMSQMHCNFMINDKNATAADLETLGLMVQDGVEQKTGIKLIWEVKLIGKK